MDRDIQAEHADGHNARPGPGQMSMDLYLDGLAQAADGTAAPAQQPSSYDQELEELAALAGAEEPRPTDDQVAADGERRDRRSSPKRHLVEVGASGAEDDGSPLSQFARTPAQTRPR